MNGKMMLAYLGVAIVILVVPNEILATTAEVSNYGAKDINNLADNLMAFIFGAPLKMAALFGMALGVGQILIGGGYKLALYCSVGMLLISAVPTFIKSVFSVLIP